jgi:hypothetical protein
LSSHAKQRGDQPPSSLEVQLLDGAKSQGLEVLQNTFEGALLLDEIRLGESLFQQRKLIQQAVAGAGRIFPPFAPGSR